MRRRLLALVLPIYATYFYAQTGTTDSNFLKLARAKYDSPFERNLQSFNCAVEFNWNQHFTEAPRVGDEGTDEEIAKLIQPLHTRVTVTRQEAKPSTDMSDEEVRKLPHGGMAEYLLQHSVQYSLNNWLAANGKALLPPEEAPVQVEASKSGYTLSLKVKNFNVEMLFTPDMRLLSEGVKGSPSDKRETTFITGPQGFLLSTFKQGEDGEFKSGNRIILTYTYQNIKGFQLPEQVAIDRESHHENWHYKLTDCSVNLAK